MTRALAWVPLFALAALLALQKIRTFDYWWHLRTGRWIAENGRVPRVDPYTYTVEGARWIDIHWLHQLGLHGLYTLGGHAAVVVAKAAFAVAIVAALATIGYRRERPLVSVAGLGLMLVLAADRIMPRPELPTFLCLAGVLALLERHARRPDAWVYAIVAIQLVWVNVHGLFALGVVVCAIYAAAELLRPVVAPGEGIDAARLRQLAAVTALAALASFANPNGVDGVLYPIEQLGMIGPPEDRGVFGSIISELIPPLAHRGQLGSPLVALFGALAALSFGAMLLNWRRLPASHPLLWIAFLYLALGAQRNVALFAIVAAPILVRNLNEFLDARPPLPRALRMTAAVAVPLVIVAIGVDVARDRFYLRLGLYRSLGLEPMRLLYPEGASEWIARERPHGRICHHMADGGYVGWRLFPDYRVMLDGRLEVYGPERFVELQVSNPERFRELDREYGFGSVLVHYSVVKSDDLLWWLHLNSNWRLVFVDDVAALYVRLPEDPSSLPPELDLDDPALFPPFPDDGEVADRMRRMARTNFWMGMKRWETALALWEETLERHPDLPQGAIIHATLLQANGLPAAAEAILRGLLAERPDDPSLHVQIGDLRVASDDLASARELYDAALAIDPNHVYGMFRRAALAEAEGDTTTAATLYLRVAARSNPADPLSIAARQRLEAFGGG